MQYTIGVYSEEYLLLLELLLKLNSELPMAEVKTCAGAELIESLPVEVAEQISQDPNELKDCDVIILLGKLPDEFFEDFDGTVIALQGFEPNFEDTITLQDPMMEYLYRLAERNRGLAINIGLPMAIYGKAGVDMLMQETRSIYSFEQYDDSILPMRIAFNMHFYKNNLPGNVLQRDVEALRKLATVNTRINPISTVFVVDIFAPTKVTFPTGIEFTDVEQDFSLEDITQNHIAARITNGNFYTIAGDYLHIRTFQILQAIKEALS